MRQLLAMLLAGVLTLLLAATVAAADSQTEVVLSGDGEPAGHPDGSGSAVVLFRFGDGSICWGISIEGIGPASGAHLYAGMDAIASELVVILEADGFDGVSEGCTVVGVDEVFSLADRAQHADAPTLFLVVATEDYPAGALHGAVWVERVTSNPVPGAPHGGLAPGECALVAAIEPQAGDAGRDALAVSVDQEVTFWGSFLPNEWVDLAFLQDGVKVGDATPALADAEGHILFLWSFRPAAEWTVIAGVSGTDCTGTVTLTVTDPTATPQPSLPDTAANPAVPTPVAPVLAVVALLGATLLRLPWRA